MSPSLSSDYSDTAAHLVDAPPTLKAGEGVTLCGGGAHYGEWWAADVLGEPIMSSLLPSDLEMTPPPLPPTPPHPMPPAPVSRRDLAAPSPLLDDVVSQTPPPHLAAPSQASAPAPLPPSAPAMLLLQAQVAAKTQSVSASHMLAAVANERKGTPPPPQCKLPASDTNTRTAQGQRYKHAYAAVSPVSRLASSKSPAPASLVAPVAATPQALLPRTKVFFCLPRVSALAGLAFVAPHTVRSAQLPSAHAHANKRESASLVTLS